MLAAKFPHFPVFFPANVPKKDFHDFDAGAGPPVRTSSVLRQNFAGGGHWVLFWYVSGRSLLFIFICSQVDVILIKCVQFYHRLASQCSILSWSSLLPPLSNVSATDCNLFSETGRASGTSWMCTGAIIIRQATCWSKTQDRSTSSQLRR